MKNITLLIFTLVGISLTGQSTAQDVDAAYDVNPIPIKTAEESSGTGIYHPMGSSGVIYSNGPYFDTAGGGFSGADISTLQTTSQGEAILGYGMNAGSSTRLADDLEILETIEITTIDFYGYQTGSTTASSFNFMSLRVWDGVPSDSNSNIIFGDETTNRLVASTWSGAYRVNEASPQDNTRPIMINTVSTPGLVLPPGDYWLDWNAGGTSGSGPWAPPISILGTSATGNAIRYTLSTNSWAPVLDYDADNETGTSEPQGFPFEINGITLSTADNVIEGFTYYPNPVKDILYVQSKSTIDTIVIYNMLGQKMHALAPAALSTNIDLSGLSAGIYVMKTTVKGVTGSFQIIRK